MVRRSEAAVAEAKSTLGVPRRSPTLVLSVLDLLEQSSEPQSDSAAATWYGLH